MDDNGGSFGLGVVLGVVVFGVSMLIGAGIIAVCGGHTTAAGVHLGPDWPHDIKVDAIVAGTLGLIAFLIGLGGNIADAIGDIIGAIVDALT